MYEYYICTTNLIKPTMSKQLFMSIREQEVHDDSVFEDTTPEELYNHFNGQMSLHNLFNDFTKIFSKEVLSANQINNEEGSI